MRITTKDVNFLTTVSNALDKEGFLVVHVDHGGPQDYYLINSPVELKKVFSFVQSKDMVSIFTKKAIPIKGKADSDLKEQALVTLSALHIKDSDECVIAIRTDNTKTKLSWGDNWIQLSSAKEVRGWFNRNHGHPIIVFPPAWINDDVIKAHGK